MIAECCCLLHSLQEFARWLGDRVTPVVVDDTRASAVKDAMQVTTSG